MKYNEASGRWVDYIFNSSVNWIVINSTKNNLNNKKFAKKIFKIYNN